MIFYSRHPIVFSVLFIVMMLATTTMFFAAGFALLQLGPNTSHRYGAALFISIALQIARMSLTFARNNR